MTGNKSHGAEYTLTSGNTRNNKHTLRVKNKQGCLFQLTSTIKCKANRKGKTPRETGNSSTGSGVTPGSGYWVLGPLLSAARRTPTRAP